MHLIRIQLALLMVAGSQLATAQLSKVGHACSSDADCVTDWETCQASMPELLSSANDNEPTTSATCVHKPQFPMSQVEFGYAFIVIAAITFTNIGGTSGGGIIIPIAMWLYHFDVKYAVALSNFSIASSGLTRQISTLG